MLGLVETESLDQGVGFDLVAQMWILRGVRIELVFLDNRCMHQTARCQQIRKRISEIGTKGIVERKALAGAEETAPARQTPDDGCH